MDAIKPFCQAYCPNLSPEVVNTASTVFKVIAVATVIFAVIMESVWLLVGSAAAIAFSFIVLTLDNTPNPLPPLPPLPSPRRLQPEDAANERREKIPTPLPSPRKADRIGERPEEPLSPPHTAPAVSDPFAIPAAPLLSPRERDDGERRTFEFVPVTALPPPVSLTIPASSDPFAVPVAFRVSPRERDEDEQRALGSAPVIALPPPSFHTAPAGSDPFAGPTAMSLDDDAPTDMVLDDDTFGRPVVATMPLAKQQETPKMVKLPDAEAITQYTETHPMKICGLDKQLYLPNTVAILAQHFANKELASDQIESEVRNMMNAAIPEHGTEDQRKVLELDKAVRSLVNECEAREGAISDFTFGLRTDVLTKTEPELLRGTIYLCARVLKDLLDKATYAPPPPDEKSWIRTPRIEVLPDA